MIDRKERLACLTHLLLNQLILWPPAKRLLLMTLFCSAKVTDPGGCELASTHLPGHLGLVCNYYMWVLPNPISVEAHIDRGVHSLGGPKGPSWAFGHGLFLMLS